jgi:hypothetical protein
VLGFKDWGNMNESCGDMLILSCLQNPPEQSAGKQSPISTLPPATLPSLSNTVLQALQINWNRPAVRSLVFPVHNLHGGPVYSRHLTDFSGCCSCP